MTLDQLNTLSLAEAADWFRQTCAAENWIARMVELRPYANIEQVCLSAKAVWADMQEADYLQAFTAHPMIGDVNSLRAKFANTKAIASNEQSGTASASEATLQGLSEQNHAYLNKHGFIFIICATGLSADTMLAELAARLPNDTASEIAKAAQEQIKITLLRINKGLSA